MKLSSRERIMKIFQGKAVDRPCVKLWGAEPGQHMLHPAYGPVSDLAVRTTDLFCGSGSPFDFTAGAASHRYETKKRPKSEEWTEVETVLHTPEGDLASIDMVSNTGKPGYTTSHFIKEPSDLKKLLSIPYEPYPVSLDRYFERDREIGDRGIVLFYLGHPGYAVQMLMGSETLAILSVDERALLLEAAHAFAGRLRRHMEAALTAGLAARGRDGGFVVGWVGPEVLIPPLMSHRDFDELCFAIDKPLIDMIHEAGGYVWIHCHGKVGRLIRRFADMGCDALNPIEPPPMGDIELDGAFQQAGGRMALEGNIEIHEIMQAKESRLRELIEDAVKTGSRYGRFILCPSAGYMEVSEPSERMIENLLTYVRFGLECAEKYRC